MVDKGRFCWYELSADNLDAAQAFYCDVIGWTAEPSHVRHDVEYRVFKAGDVRVAGLTNTQAGGPKPFWLGYVEVDDADAAAARIEADPGGAIYRHPVDLDGIGRVATFGDTQGAILALMQFNPDYKPEPKRLEAPGHGGWNEMMTKNWPVAFDFLSGIFGWRKGEAIDMGPMGIYQLFGLGDRDFGGLMEMPDDAPGPMWLTYFNVPDVDAAAKRVEAGGGTLLSDIHEVPGGTRVVRCRDPQGALFALSSTEQG